MRISVRGVDELKAVVIGYSRLESPLRTEINRATRQALNPIWQGELSRRMRTTMDERVMGAGAKVKAGNPPVLQAAQSNRAIGGRLRPATAWQGWEFGSDRDETSTYRRRTRSGSTTVTRHTARQMPARNRKGRVAYAALTGTAPRAAALWVQTVVRLVHEAAEGKLR